MIKRDEIINMLNAKLEPLPYINALWLEGSDANDTVDEYSDIDFWVDFEDEYEEETVNAVESAFTDISEIDDMYIMKHGHPKIRQRIYHLKDTSEYLMIDFCWQLHSRSKDEYSYLIGDKIEAAKIIFDKSNIISYKQYNHDTYKTSNDERLKEAEYKYTQHCRVMKYVLRKQYLEAYAYYNKYVLEPLIDLLRIIYTPAHTDYYLVHISQHIPESEKNKLEYYAKISSLEDIKERIPKAKEWFRELHAIINI